MRFATCYTRSDLLPPFRSLPLADLAIDHVRRKPEAERRKLETFLDEDGEWKQLADAGEPYTFPFLPEPRRSDLEQAANAPSQAEAFRCGYVPEITHGDFVQLSDCAGYWPMTIHVRGVPDDERIPSL